MVIHRIEGATLADQIFEITLESGERQFRVTGFEAMLPAGKS